MDLELTTTRVFRGALGASGLAGPAPCQPGSIPSRRFASAVPGDARNSSSARASAGRAEALATAPEKMVII